MNQCAQRFFILLCGLFVVASNAFAQRAWHPVVSMGGGLAFSSVGDANYLPVQSNTVDQFYNYTPSRVTKTSGLANIFVGAEWRLRQQWLMQAGFEFNQTALNTNGTLVQGADVPSQDTYRYQYGILSKQFLAEAKLLYSFRDTYHPYVLAGAGVGVNRSYNFSTNVPPFLAFTRMYGGYTKTSFSYAVGLGVDTNLAPELRFGVGYRFADLGKVNLGNATIDTTSVPNSVSQTHSYTNEVLAQLTFLFA